MAGCAPSGQKRRVFKDAGRVCPIDYRIAPDAFAGEQADSCDVLYVVGGLYGNPFALDAIDKMVASETGQTRVVLNGDMHWFDKTAENFAALEEHARRYTPLVGNVEAELRRQVDVGVGCGCAYPECTSDESVSRSNRIHRHLSDAIHQHPELGRLLDGRPATATLRVAGCKVAVTHGDEKLIGGWDCSRESMQDVLRQDELDLFLERNGIDVLTTTHTCATAALGLPHGLVLNNGAAGLPNFAGQRFGLAVRIAATPHPDALISSQIKGVFVEAVPVRYDHDAYLTWFDSLWSPTSPAAISYRDRIVDGPVDYVTDALLGGFSTGPSVDDGRLRPTIDASKDTVAHELASLVYFEDRVSDSAKLRTEQQLDTLQLNITAKCNLACSHCHVESSPRRTERMTRETLEQALEVAQTRNLSTIDITGGAPEMHPDFSWLIEAASQRADRVLVRTNLVILADEAYASLLDEYAHLGIEVVASLPNVFAAQSESQRGSKTFDTALEVLHRLTERGYGRDGTHVLDLTFNPQWPTLAPLQAELEEVYARRLRALDVSFDNLFAVTNCPIGRYGVSLMRNEQLEGYLDLLQDSFNDDAVEHLMCRHQLSVGWDGRVYDCDFNQALGLGVEHDGKPVYIGDYAQDPDLPLARSISFGGHCYACAAGQGSSCTGTLIQA